MTLRARDIADLCDDLALERASVTVKEGWDYNPQFYVTFGPAAYRQTMLIDPNWGIDEVRVKLMEPIDLKAAAAKLAGAIPDFPNHAMPPKDVVTLKKRKKANARP